MSDEELATALKKLNMQRACLEKVTGMTPVNQREARVELEKEYQDFCEKHGLLPKRLGDTNGREAWNDFVGGLRALRVKNDDV
jgi:hypothetical protein